MKGSLLFILVLIAIQAPGQSPVTWHPGSLVLIDGQVRQGELSFQTSLVVLFRASDKVMIYKPYQVSAFYFFDRTARINRKYFSIGSSHRTRSFYEVVVWGSVCVVRQLKSDFVLPRQASDKFDYHYFIYDHNQLTRLKHFQRHVYPNLIFHHQELLAFIKKEGLEPYRESDVIQIVKYYNQNTTSPSLASNH